MEMIDTFRVVPVNQKSGFVLTGLFRKSCGLNLSLTVSLSVCLPRCRGPQLHHSSSLPRAFLILSGDTCWSCQSALWTTDELGVGWAGKVNIGENAFLLFPKTQHDHGARRLSKPFISSLLDDHSEARRDVQGCLWWVKEQHARLV